MKWCLLHNPYVDEYRLVKLSEAEVNRIDALHSKIRPRYDWYVSRVYLTKSIAIEEIKRKQTHDYIASDINKVRQLRHVVGAAMCCG